MTVPAPMSIRRQGRGPSSNEAPSAADLVWPGSVLSPPDAIPRCEPCDDASLRHGGMDASGVSWLGSATPCVERSSILEPEYEFNGGTRVTVGAARATGAPYMYSDPAFSDGNYFAGLDGSGGISAPTGKTRGTDG